MLNLHNAKMCILTFVPWVNILFKGTEEKQKHYIPCLTNKRLEKASCIV